MKKILLLTVVLMLLVVPVAFAGEDVPVALAEEEAPVSKFKSVLKITFDGKGEVEGTSSSYGTITLDVDSGFSIGSEFTKLVNPNLDAGVGISVQLPRGITDTPYDFRFIPIYGLVRAYPSPEQLPVYLTGQLGWNYFDSNMADVDCSGGLYYGTGVGYMSKQFLVELLYSKNSGTSESYGETEDDEYTKVGLSVGIVF